jgi:hypothetical protein
VDDAGKIVREVKVASEPEALLAALKNPAYHFKRIGLEAGLAIRVVAPTMCARTCRAVLSGVHILLTETGLAGWGGRTRTSASVIVPDWAYRYCAARRVAADRAPDPSRRVHDPPSPQDTTAVKPAGRRFLVYRFKI